MSQTIDIESLRSSIIDIAVESWRFKRVLLRILSKLPPEEQRRHEGQFRFYAKKIETALETCGLKFASIEGKTYEPGDAVTALNIDEFEADDQLIVEQMVEPIVLSADGTIVRLGSVILRKV